MIRPSRSDEREDAVKQRLSQTKVAWTSLRSSSLRIHAYGETGIKQRHAFVAQVIK
jgi:hypothetical protein